MTARHCWTCNGEHDLDKACKQSPAARTHRAAGGSSGLFGGAASEPEQPAFEASYDGPCSAGDDISEGELIRADGDGGWIHVDCEDEA